jgi:hypothetical protein
MRAHAQVTLAYLKHEIRFGNGVGKNLPIAIATHVPVIILSLC